MSADPTVAELASFVSLKEVLTWAAVEELPTDVKTADGSLLALLGATPTTLPPRSVGIIDEGTRRWHPG